MAVRSLRIFPDPVLSEPCGAARLQDAALSDLIDDLWDTLHSTPGVGLAAPQIGVARRVSVIDISRSKRHKDLPSHGRIVLINPELIDGSGVQLPREGCLSVPDLLANVRRYDEVTIRTEEATGRKRILRAKGFEALALQHEIDHLDGKLFLDRVANLKTDLFRRKM